MQNGRLDRRAFTLLELLVVMAILAILVLLLLPSILSSKRAAKKVVCINNCHQLATALLLYVADNNENFPPASGASFNWTPGYGWDTVTRADYWWNVTKPYYKDSNLLLCPSAAPGELVQHGEQYPQYGTNTGQIATSGPGSGWNSINGLGQVSTLETVNLKDVTIPSKTLLIGESSDPLRCANYGSTGSGGTAAAYRHGNLAIFAFVDGHIEGVNSNALNNLATWLRF